VIRVAFEQGKKSTSGPGNAPYLQARAYRLGAARGGIPLTLITDNMVATS